MAWHCDGCCDPGAHSKTIRVIRAQTYLHFANWKFALVARLALFFSRLRGDGDRRFRLIAEEFFFDSVFVCRCLSFVSFTLLLSLLVFALAWEKGTALRCDVCGKEEKGDRAWCATTKQRTQCGSVRPCALKSSLRFGACPCFAQVE